MKVASKWMVMLVLLCGWISAEQLSVLNFVILKDYNGKPIRNASVIMHPVRGNGKQAKTGLELKTDAEGKTAFDGVPFGKLRIQIIAQGYQTFGDDYSIDKPEMEIVVKMKRPGEQYSIYKDHPPDKRDDKKEDQKDDKKEDKKPEGTKPEDKQNR
jgi:hypothetical protein